MSRHRAFLVGALVALLTMAAGAIAASAPAAAPSIEPTPPPTDYLAATPAQQVGPGVRFDVRQPKRLKTATSPGRVVVFILKKSKLLKDGSNPPFKANPIQGANTHPAFGENLPGRMGPGRHFVLREGTSTVGYPLLHIGDLRAGTYVVQAVFIRYTVFHLANGKTVQLPMPCGDGAEKLRFQPGNLVSNIVPVTLKPHHRMTVHLTFKSQNKPADAVPKGGSCQQGNPKETAHVKQVKIKSALLSKFWGRPMYIAADVLLPAGYDSPANANLRYPEIMNIDHYGEASPGGYAENGTDEFSKTWDAAAAAPRMIYISPRTETPYYDDSYGINGANTGPWGDAINKELLPYIESHFRTIGQRWARVTTGGSTGGWTAVAQQVFYPDTYEGTFSFSPDPLDFHGLQAVDIYHDPNAYWRSPDGYQRLPVVDERISGLDGHNGMYDIAMNMENYQELVRGTHNRGNGVWDGAWGADFGPQGADGYPKPLWNKVTGKIDRKVAQYWKRWDLTQVVTHDWATLGPKLAGQIEVNVGDSDNFYLNNGVHLFQNATNTLTNPSPSFTFGYFSLYGHEDLPVFNPDPVPPIGENAFGWDKFFQHVADHMAADAPAGAPTDWMHAAG